MKNKLYLTLNLLFFLLNVSPIYAMDSPPENKADEGAVFPNKRIRFYKPTADSLIKNKNEKFTITLNKVTINRTDKADGKLEGSKEEGLIALNMGNQYTPIPWKGRTGPHKHRKHKEFIFDTKVVVFHGDFLDLQKSITSDFSIYVLEAGQGDKKNVLSVAKVIKDIGRLGTFVPGSFVVDNCGPMFTESCNIVSDVLGKISDRIGNEPEITCTHNFTESRNLPINAGPYRLCRFSEGDLTPEPQEDFLKSSAIPDIEFNFTIEAFKPYSTFNMGEKVRAIASSFHFDPAVSDKLSQSNRTAILSVNGEERKERRILLKGPSSHNPVIYEGLWQGAIPLSAYMVCIKEKRVKNLGVILEDSSKTISDFSPHHLINVIPANDILLFSIEKRMIGEQSTSIQMQVYEGRKKVGKMGFNLNIYKVSD